MKWLIPLFVLPFISISASAQQFQPEVLAADGGQSKTSSVQLEWTLGETAISGYSDGSRIYTEGFHQPILRVEKVYDQPAKGDQKDNTAWGPVELYPNPASEEITILHSGISEPEIVLVIHDARGQVIQRHEIESGLPSIHLDIAALFPGLYFITVTGADPRQRSIYKMTKI